MKIDLMNLISTPVPELNSFRVNPRVGLNSENPIVVRRPSEAYQVYVTPISQIKVNGGVGSRRKYARNAS